MARPLAGCINHFPAVIFVILMATTLGHCRIAGQGILRGAASRQIPI